MKNDNVELELNCIILRDMISQQDLALKHLALNYFVDKFIIIKVLRPQKVFYQIICYQTLQTLVIDFFFFESMIYSLSHT